jgi:hypothetical protein
MKTNDFIYLRMNVYAKPKGAPGHTRAIHC